MNDIIQKELEEFEKEFWDDKHSCFKSMVAIDVMLDFLSASNKRVALAVLENIEAGINQSKIDGFLISLSAAKKIIEKEIAKFNS